MVSGVPVPSRDVTYQTLPSRGNTFRFQDVMESSAPDPGNPPRAEVLPVRKSLFSDTPSCAGGDGDYSL